MLLGDSRKDTHPNPRPLWRPAATGSDLKHGCPVPERGQQTHVLWLPHRQLGATQDVASGLAEGVAYMEYSSTTER